MKKAARVVLLLQFLLATAVAQDHSQYPGHDSVLKLGARHDAKKLAALRDASLRSATDDQRFVIFLASRIASPGKFTDEFVQSFPDRRDAWPDLANVDVDRYVRPNFEFYVAGEIASIAESGYELAIRKLVHMAAWVDGAWAEIINGGLVQCLINFPKPTLSTLGSLDAETRKRVLETSFALNLVDEDVPKLLAAVRGARSSFPVVAAEVERAATLKRRGGAV